MRVYTYVNSVYSRTQFIYVLCQQIDMHTMISKHKSICHPTYTQHSRKQCATLHIALTYTIHICILPPYTHDSHCARHAVPADTHASFDTTLLFAPHLYMLQHNSLCTTCILLHPTYTHHAFCHPFYTHHAFYHPTYTHHAFCHPTYTHHAFCHHAYTSHAFCTTTLFAPQFCILAHGARYTCILLHPTFTNHTFCHPTYTNHTFCHRTYRTHPACQRAVPADTHAYSYIAT